MPPTYINVNNYLSSFLWCDKIREKCIRNIFIIWLCCYSMDKVFLPMRQSLFLFLAVLENSVLPVGWDSSHETLKMTSAVYKRSIRNVTKKPNGVWSWPSYNVIVNIFFKSLIFPVIGKKNNHSSAFDADREIPTLGSTDNAGNAVNLVSGIIR